MNWPIKQKALDDHLPSNSELRLYLSQKDETAKIVRPRFEPNLADYRTIPNPKVLLVLRPCACTRVRSSARSHARALLYSRLPPTTWIRSQTPPAERVA